jgi:hypothetical protein
MSTPRKIYRFFLIADGEFAQLMLSQIPGELFKVFPVQCELSKEQFPDNDVLSFDIKCIDRPNAQRYTYAGVFRGKAAFDLCSKAFKEVAKQLYGQSKEPKEMTVSYTFPDSLSVT